MVPRVTAPSCLLRLLAASIALTACDSEPEPQPPTPELPDEPSPVIRNVTSQTAYVGDAACTTCHAAAASAYERHPMARSFHARRAM